MNILLDTHVALWAVIDSDELSQQAVELIQNSKNQIYVSVASLWEIAIKYSLGRGDMPLSSQKAFNFFEESGFFIADLSITAIHAIEKLPWHHRDPFDRMLIAQARVMGWCLMTHDQAIAQYRNEVTLKLI